MDILLILKVIFISSLITIGLTYISYYTYAPYWERIQVFGIGLGMLIGVIVICTN